MSLRLSYPCKIKNSFWNNIKAATVIEEPLPPLGMIVEVTIILLNGCMFLISYFDLDSNWGTENDPDMKYHSGNSEPKGFGKCKLCWP